MPLTAKGSKILEALIKQYGSEEEAKRILYAGKNAGTFTGIDAADEDDWGGVLRTIDKEFSTEKRKKLAKTGAAMKGGGYPIESEADLKNAIQAIGRAKNPAATKAHIKSRARSLGLSKLIPENWDAVEDAMRVCPECDGAGKDEGGFKCEKCDGEGYVGIPPSPQDARRKPPDDDDDDDYDDEDMEDSAPRVQFTDSFIIDNVRKRQNGYLVANARVARTGIQLYNGDEVGMPSMEMVRVYRPPGEVFNKAAMRSMTGLPVTLEHPPCMVDSSNWHQYAIGQTGEDVARDGEYLRVPMMMMDAKAIDAYEKHGVSQLSVGYSTELKWGKGRTKDGEVYDAKQTAIRGNHLAVVPAARGGSLLRIGDDHQKGDSEMVRIIIDGQGIEFANELAAKHVQDHIAYLQKMFADQKKKADEAEAEEEEEEEKKTRAEKDAAAKDGEIAVLKKQLDEANAKSSGKALSDAVKAHTDLLMKAHAVTDGKINFDGKEPSEIRRIAVAAKFGDEFAKALSDAELVGAFKSLTVDVKPNTGVDRLADSLSALSFGGGTTQSPQAIRDAAYNKYVADLGNAWRNPGRAAV